VVTHELRQRSELDLHRIVDFLQVATAGGYGGLQGGQHQL